MDALIIKACLNGLRGREDNPNVPWTPREVAAEALRCAEAGATAVHFHARGPDGAILYDPAWYTETDRLIRAQSKIVLNHTTARLPDAPIEAVLDTLRDTPEPVDAVSLNPGQIVFHMPPVQGSRKTLSLPNSYNEVVQIASLCRERGIVAEPTALDSGFLSNIAMLVEDGVIASPRQLLLEFSGRFGDGMQIMPGTPHAYRFMTDCVRELFPEAIWVAHGIEASAFTIAELAIRDGAHPPHRLRGPRHRSRRTTRKEQRGTRLLGRGVRARAGARAGDPSSRPAVDARREVTSSRLPPTEE